MNPAAETSKAFAALAQGRYAEAARHARAVLQQHPEDRACLTVLGRVTLINSEPGHAEALFRQVLAQPPAMAATWLDLEQAQSALRKHEQAQQSLQHALALEPDNLQALLRTGVLELSLGNQDQAADLFRRCLSQQARCLPALKGLGQMGRISLASPEFAAMEDWLRDGSASLPEEAELRYLLAQVYRRADEPDAFVAQLLQANRVQRQALPGSREQYAQQFERLDDAFAKAELKRIPVAAATSVTPIFVLGMHRSGTTLVEQLLAAHGDVASGGEIDYLRRILPGVVTRQTGERYPQGLDRLNQASMNELARAYTQRVEPMAAGCAMIVDKTPGNYHLLGLLPRLFAQAPIVHVRRDPMDTCFSILQQAFDQPSPHTCDMELLAYVYGHYRGLMERWERVCPGFLTVDYEELVRDPAMVAARIYRHCKLEWDPRYLEDFRRGSAVQTFSAVQVRQPISSRSVGASKPYAAALQPLQDALRKELAPQD